MKQRAPKRPAPERKRLILKGAQAVFAGSSYGDAATADVAKAAGVSAAALYRYFPSKKDLYVAALRESGQRLQGIWRRMMSGAAGPVEAVLDVGMAYYDHLRSREAATRLWFRALCETNDADVRRVLAENFTAAVGVLEENLRRGQAEGRFRKDVDARIAAWHFMSIGLTFDLLHLLGLDGELDREKVEAWGRLYLRGVCEGPDAEREG